MNFPYPVRAADSSNKPQSNHKYPSGPQDKLGALPFQQFADLTDLDAIAYCQDAKQSLGEKVTVLCHHYQRPEVFRFADLTGDSLKLSQMASQTKANYLVFCGVHFMAEVADMLSQPHQVAILPDMAAGCSMADMANLAQLEDAWSDLTDAGINPDETITPITYINSSAELKAFCGAHGGIVCTSSNAKKIVEWALQRRPKVMFLPDQHLGRWTGHTMNVPLEQMPVWEPEKPLGGLTAQKISESKFLLWAGHCSVHQMFQPSHIHAYKKQYPNAKIISHPEAPFEVCQLSDVVGSTEAILKAVHNSEPGSNWLVGTELNLVRRLAEDVASKNITVRFMSSIVCNCSTMARIDPQHLAWVLGNLQQGIVVNRITVDDDIRHDALLSITRMLEAS